MIRIPASSFYVALVAHCFAFSLAAQTYATSPSGLLNKVGNALVTLIGSTPDGRYMMLDGEMRGASRQLKGVAMRRASKYAQVVNEARSWKRVQLRIGHTDLIQTYRSFSLNFRGTPAKVFDRAVTWPDYVPSRTLPGFGGAAGELTFPFASPWSYSGRLDVCLDFDFSGGKLSNSAAWTRSVPYSLGGVVVAANEAKSELGTKFGTSCRDSSQSVAAGVDMASVSYGLVGMRSSAWGRLDLQTFLLPHHYRVGTDATGFNHYRPSIHLLSLAGSAQGVAVPGVACARLHLDLSNATLQFFPNTFRGSYHGIPPQFRFPYNGRMGGTQVWYQAAWSDSKTGQTHLTNAVRTRIARLPYFVARLLISQPDPKLKSSSGYPYPSSPGVVLRYRW